MELLNKLGIDWRLLIAQLVNFLILLGVLYKFAYKPLLKLLQERSTKIEKSLEDAKKIEENLAHTNEEQRRIVLEAQREAQKIRESVIANAEKQGEEILERTRAQAEEVIHQAKKQIEAHKKEMIHEAQTEIADMVLQASEKVLGEIVSDEIDRTLIEQSTKEFSI